MAALSEIRISRKRALTSIFKDYEVFSSCGLLGASDGVVVLLWKPLNLQAWVIFLDLDGRVVVLDVIGSESGTFRLVVVYAPTEAGR